MSFSMWIYVGAGFKGNHNNDNIMFYKGYSDNPSILYTPKCSLISTTDGASSDGPRIQIQVNNYEDTVPSTVVSTEPIEMYKWILLTVSMTQQSVSIYFGTKLVAYKGVPLIKFNNEPVFFYPTGTLTGVAVYDPYIYNFAVDPNAYNYLLNRPPPSNIGV